MSRRRILILGAAGRDFHNFNTVYREDPANEVVAFTATQIPDIAGRRYPPSLAGRLYPAGIPIEDQGSLEKLIVDLKIDECVLSYSDLSYQTVMHLASRVNASGADFSMLAAGRTMLSSTKPVIAVVAVRTGCGKSQTSRAIVQMLRAAGKKVVSIRHPMPYGDLEQQRVQRFASLDDLKQHKCTIEEMEEYEPHIAMGSVIYAGVDYGQILEQAQREADVIIWDGGNNDTSFYRPDYTVVVADPLRAGHEIAYYPGEVNLRLADAVIINKTDSASSEQIETVKGNIRAVNPAAAVICADSVVSLDDQNLPRGRRVLVIEDGPTLTHGEMKIGAGTVAAQRAGAASLVDPRPYAVGKIAETFRNYPDIGVLLPAMGYGSQQMSDLEKTINAVPCDAVVIGTPIDLGRFIRIEKPATRVRYELSAQACAKLRQALGKFL